MSVHFTVLHPRVCHGNAVAILIFICKLAVAEGVALLYDTAFEYLIACEHIIYDMLVDGRRAYLQMNGLAVCREFLRTHIEPVVRFHYGLLVFQREHHHILLYSVVAADRKQMVFARFQAANGNGGVRLLVLISLSAKRERYRTVDWFIRRIGVIESYLLQTVVQNHVGQVARQCRRLCTEGQTERARMALTAHIGNLCLSNEIEERSATGHNTVFIVVGIGHFHRHYHLERAVNVGHCLTLVEVVFVQIVLTPPAPESAMTAYVVFYLRSLHRHTGVSLGVCLHSYGVAGGILFLVIGELNFECGTFVFLNLYANAVAFTAFSLNRETSGEPTLRYGEVNVCRSVFVGLHSLLSHTLVVGIAKAYPHILVG